jgi:hypothetical protein
MLMSIIMALYCMRNITTYMFKLYGDVTADSVPPPPPPPLRIPDDASWQKACMWP